MKTLFRGALCLAAALVGAGSAQAGIVLDVDVTNSYGGVHFPGKPDLGVGGTSRNDRSPGTWMTAEGTVAKRAEYGINYVGEADAGTGSFFFLHNNFCVGTCGTASKTVITFTIRNDGDAEQSLRFDSLITPGHLARLGSSSFGEAGFDFTVTQDPDAAARRLYSAAGRVTGTEMGVTTLDGVAFNGMRQTDAAGWTVLDWGATNLNLDLGVLGAGQTTVLAYEANYYSYMSGTCLDLTDCTGVQVVFGDPRANGSGMNSTGLSELEAALADEPLRDVIDPLYKRYATTFAVVSADAPLPGPPPVMPERRYGNTFSPTERVVNAAVPESGTWAMMLVGAGLIGATLRRRRITFPAGAAVAGLR